MKNSLKGSIFPQESFVFATPCFRFDILSLFENFFLFVCFLVSWLILFKKVSVLLFLIFNFLVFPDPAVFLTDIPKQTGLPQD